MLAQIAATPDENGKYWYDHKKLITLKLAVAATVRALSAHHPLMRCEGFCPVCAIPHRNNRHQECPHVKTAVDAHRCQSNVPAGMGLSARNAPAMTPEESLDKILALQLEAFNSGLRAVCQNFLRGRCTRNNCAYLHPGAGAASSSN